MYVLIAVMAFVIAMQSMVFRTFIMHIPSTIFYGIKDLYDYVKNKRWKEWRGYGFAIYTGLFGYGKTLTVAEFVISVAKKFNLNVYSNIWLDYPYTPLENYQQIIDAPGNSIFLVDEISTLFNAREWSKFPIGLLFQILQCRKRKKMLVSTAQRYSHVDKLLRDITFKVIVCHKVWRYQTLSEYDPAVLENAQEAEYIKPLRRKSFFVRDKHYKQYNTEELIDNFAKEKFLSNEKVLERRAPVQGDLKNVADLSKKGKKVAKR